MSFADNLRQIRKENNLPQEELAELLEVSRQAVSKWEQGQGYPEVEKLLVLSKKLNISLDNLMATEHLEENSVGNDSHTREIMITSPNENVITKCYKVVSSQEFKGGKSAPKYALYGVDGLSLWGENTTFLGWYADKESISKEVSEIQSAMKDGADSYELKYSVRTEKHWLGMKMINQ